jgi:hypothetical protein
MAKRRLNDTAALVTRPPGSGESHGVSVRKIDNGYMISQHSSNERTGEYSCTESYSERAPRIIPARVAYGPAPDQGNSLRGAVQSLGQDE